MPSVTPHVSHSLALIEQLPFRQAAYSDVLSFPGHALRPEHLPELDREVAPFERGAARSRVLPSLLQFLKQQDIACPAPNRMVTFPDAEPGFDLSANLYLPDGPAPRSGWPTVMPVYGGAFMMGEKNCHHNRNVVNAMTARGIAVMTVEYRKIPQTHFTRLAGLLKRWREGNLQHAVNDVTRAVDWYAANAGSAGLDPARLATMGFSAGAMIGALTAAHRQDKVRAFVGFYGPYVPEFFAGVLGKILRLATYGTRFSPEEKAAYHPLAATFSGPVLLVHGDKDELSYHQHSFKLAADRVRRGLETYLHVEHGAAHGIMNDPADKFPAVAKLLGQTGDFLEEIFRR